MSHDTSSRDKKYGQMTKKNVVRGCPQGSCLGPVLWLMVAETYLSQVRDAHVVTAFADDFLLQTTEKNRRVLENKIKLILKTLECWAED